MLNKMELKEALREIITPNSVFVCIGTHKAIFDAFAPYTGDYLEVRGVPVYGTTSANVNALTMKHRLHEIYRIDKIDKKDIIAIDAAVTSNIEKKNKIEVRVGSPISPGAGVGKNLPDIGAHSIVMYTLTKDEVSDVMNGYKCRLGSVTDLSDIDAILENAFILADAIAEVYEENKII